MFPGSPGWSRLWRRPTVSSLYTSEKVAYAGDSLESESPRMYNPVMRIGPIFFILLFSSLGVAVSLVDPKNDPDVQPHIQRGYFELKEGDGQPSSNTTQADVLQMRDDFLVYAEPRLAGQTRRLMVSVDWDNPYYTAHARYNDKELYIGLWGGFLRAPGMNTSILAFTLCHELGHLVGGEPRQTNEKGENVTAEGPSDFFAAFQCAADFLGRYPQYQPVVSDQVRELCQNSPACELSLESGFQTFQFLQKWGFAPYEPASLTKKAPPVDVFVPNTYPSYQCRVDTVVAGALCLRDQRANCEPPPCWWPQGQPYPSLVSE